MAYTTIDNPELYFQVKAYAGTGSSNAQTFDGDEDMQPDLVWIKNRDQALNWMMFDAVRGTTKYFYSNLTEAEGTNDPATILTAFGSDGFTVGANNNVNQSSNDIVAICWKESATAGFDIVGYTGNETARTQAHSLSAVPHVMIVKNRETTDDWNVYHHKNTSAPETDYLNLHDDGATSDYHEFWNDTVPTSGVFSLGASTGVNDDLGMIAYLWSEKQGFSKFGSYTGNGNNDGTYVHTGFAPAFVLIKKSSASGTSWVIFDNKRNTFNERSRILQTNDNGAEETSTNRIDFTSNGFKLRGTWTVINNSGDTYIYMAFAEAPFVNSNGVPCNAR